MIISALTGGMGNQLFQYAAGFALARRKRTSFRIDLNFYNYVYPGVPFRPYVLDRLKISTPTVTRLDQFRLGLSTETGRFRRLKRVLDGVPGLGFDRLIDVLQGYDSRFESTSSRTHLYGNWETEKYFADCREPLLREFQFKEPPNEANRAMLQEIGRGTAVCVHVRRGDLLTPGNHTQPCSVDYYNRAIGLVGRQFPDARYFLFSDDPAWARSNLSMPAASTFVTHNVGIADTEDLRLMAACNHFIIANSTFSWWGAWLSNSPEKRVIAPAHWFARLHGSDGDIVPARWERI